MVPIPSFRPSGLDPWSIITRHILLNVSNTLLGSATHESSKTTPSGIFASQSLQLDSGHLGHSIGLTAATEISSVLVLHVGHDGQSLALVGELKADNEVEVSTIRPREKLTMHARIESHHDGPDCLCPFSSGMMCGVWRRPIWTR